MTSTAKRFDRIGIETQSTAQLGEQGPDVGLERLDEYAVGAEHVAVPNRSERRSKLPSLHEVALELRCDEVEAGGDETVYGGHEAS